jgi:hypothetical protein
LRAAELAETANAILARRGESLQVSSESAGCKLKFLGLRSEPIGTAGNGLWLLNETRTKIHDLALECGSSLTIRVLPTVALNAPGSKRGPAARQVSGTSDASKTQLRLTGS